MTQPPVIRASEDYSQAQDVWSDGFSVFVNDFTATLNLGKRGVKAGETMVYLYRVRMPLAQLKAMALMGLRLIRLYESQAGVTISLPPKLLESYGIPPEDWRGGP